MTVDAQILDQILVGIVPRLKGKIESSWGQTIEDENRLKPLSFVFKAVKSILDLDDHEAFEAITDGGHDNGIDAVYVSNIDSSEFTITVFQCKYSMKLQESHFEGTAIEKMIHGISLILDPQRDISATNERLQVKLSEIHSLIEEGKIPFIRIIICNNGIIWTKKSQTLIDNQKYGVQVSWDYYNHQSIISLLTKPKPIDELLRCKGAAHSEDVNFHRAFIGKMSVVEIAELMKRHGDRLLVQNVRSYLGLKGNRVNQEIRRTLLGKAAEDFYFLNNGITFICDHYDYNAGQKLDYNVRVKNLKIVNGGQTCMTILKVSQELKKNKKTLSENAEVLVRLYTIGNENKNFARDITIASNSQSPITLFDLHANDEIQVKLELSMKELGYNYIRKRGDSALGEKDITISEAAEAVMAVWRQKPHLVKYRSNDLLNKHYHEIFTETLTGAQLVLAVEIYREINELAHFMRSEAIKSSENRVTNVAAMIVRYGNCFLSMEIGKQLLQAMTIHSVEEITHKNLSHAFTSLKENSKDFYHNSLDSLHTKLREKFGQGISITSSQFSGLFRRGDIF